MAFYGSNGLKVGDRIKFSKKFLEEAGVDDYKILKTVFKVSNISLATSEVALEGIAGAWYNANWFILAPKVKTRNLPSWF